MAKRDDVKLHCTRTPEGASTAVKRGTSREYIVYQDEMKPRIKWAAPDECKGIFQIRHPGPAIESRLRWRIDIPPQQPLDPRAPACRPSQRGGQQFRLIITPLTSLSRMQRHRDHRRAPRTFQHMGRPSKDFLHVFQHVQSAMVLQFDHQGPSRPFEEHGRTPFPKGRIESLAFRTHPFAFHDTKKRVSTGRAVRRPRKLQLLRASHTHMAKRPWAVRTFVLRSPVHGLATVHAERREEDVTHATQQLPGQVHANVQS